MSSISFLRTIAVSLSFGVTLAPSIMADSASLTMPEDDTSEGGPVLVELFTSQSCSSCPPAEAVFSDLADRKDLVVIEWHVDYWDDLMYGRAGKWKDPFSSPAYTERQRAYNLTLRGMRSVYTPQAIIAGVSETVGSREGVLSRMINGAPKRQAELEMTDQTVTVSADDNAEIAPADVMLVTLLPEQTTNVAAGENKGRRLASRNIAIDMIRLGEWSGPEVAYDLPPLDAGLTCAVLVQDPNTKLVYGASYCSNG